MATKVGSPVYMSGCNYQLGYDVLSQNSATNKSTVRLYGFLTVTNNVVSWSSGSASVHTSGLMAIGPSYNRGEHIVVYKDFEWEHDANGNFSMWIGASLSTTFVSGNTGGVITLPKIDRYATITATPSSLTDEGTPYITFTNAGNATNPNVWLEVNPPSSHYAIRYLDMTSGTYTWDLTDAERNQLRSELANAKTGTLRIGIYSTLNGTEGATYKDIPFSIVNANPNFDVAYLDTNSTATAITQNDQQIIQNISTLQVNLTNVTALKEATLSSANIWLNGVTYNASTLGSSITFNIGTLNISSDTSARVTLTDSRGNNRIKNVPITFLEYSLPSGLITLNRRNNFYSETDIKVDANYSSLDNKNQVEIKVRTKKTSDSTYGAYTTLQDNVTSTLTLDNLYQWDVQVVISDSVGGSTTYNYTIDKGIPIVFYDRLKRSVGINSFPQNDSTLDILGGDVLNVLGTKTDTWSSGGSYAKRDIVAYNRTLYKNLTGTNSGSPDTDTTNWEETSILSNLLGMSKSSNYLTFGSIGICWGQAHPTYANANVLLANDVSLPLSFTNGRCIASTVNYNNVAAELDAITKVPNTVTGNTMSLALHSAGAKFASSSTSFYINYIVIGTIV